MEKNIKLRNGLDQIQNYCVIETENQEIQKDFLTSDDFCIVQKKKSNKKFFNSPDFDTHFHSQTNFGKNSDEETGKSHTSFWTCKFNGNSNDDNLETTECGLQSPDGKQNDCSENFEFHTESESCNHTLKLNSKIPLISGEKPSFVDVKPESCSCITIKNDNFEVKSFDECVVNENVSCQSKKKNKKRVHKKKCIDEEVEKLLRELENDDKLSVKIKKAVKCTSAASCNITSQHLSSKDCINSITIDDYNTSSVKNGKTSHLEITSQKQEKEVLVNSPSNKRNTDFIILVETENAESLLAAGNSNEAGKMSENRKGKRTKTKQKIIGNVNLKSDKCDITSVDLSNIQGTAEEESTFCFNKEEKMQKSLGKEEPVKKGKRPNKKQLALIHDALKKAKEEEERQKKKEEIKRKMAEEAERIRQEKLQQEQEKKEKKKLKLKQRREKMKAEGRLLSKSQKQSRARMEATLAAFRQQGIDVPQISDKKPLSRGPRLGSCKNFQRKRYDSCQSTQSSDSAIVISERQKSESFSSQESSGKDSLSDLPNSFDGTEEITLTPEFDKGFFNCFQESDRGNENICCNVANEDLINSKISTEKSKKYKSGILSEHQVKSLESELKVNDVKYRSPVVCVLGHVDTGKTKLLDYIRKTHVQDSEAGGITQQIGATMIPQDALKEKCKMVNNFSSFKMKIPGLLVIDTPGHESFSNLRSRGSSICDIAVLVVDIMHGLEPQTIESINLLKRGKTPFIVALNKVDRIYGWMSEKDEDIEYTIKNQSHTTQMEFKKRCQSIILQFANQCLNATLIYENKDPRSYVSMVPTSAITGDGMGNVLSSIVQLSQTLMNKKLIYSSELEATVLEVKAIPGLGTTIDVILVNGRLQEGDTIVLAGQEGPIVTQIRSLLMPRSLKELRVKNPYIEYKTIEGAQGVKISGKDLEKSIAGLPLLVASNHNMIEVLKDEINILFRDTINSIKASERGVYVQASTLGSLEALLDFLSASGVPYFNVKIGPVVKKDVMKASIMLEHDIMYAAILAFDVEIERDAQELADNLGVHIFHADIIYHLIDMYINFRDNLLLKRDEELKRHAVFPCKLRISPEFIFNPRDPIVCGVKVEQGSLRVGTPICIPSKDMLEIGFVSSIEMNNNKINCAKKGDEVCIKIDPKPGEFPKTYGKHFSCEDLLVSRISRQSIDVCKDYFRSELQSCDWHLIVELKKMLHIV